MSRLLSLLALLATWSIAAAQPSSAQAATGDAAPAPSLTSRCESNTPGLTPNDWAVAVCANRKETTIASLYEDVASGEHYEARELSALIVARRDEPLNQWRFIASEGTLIVAAFMKATPASSLRPPSGPPLSSTDKVRIEIYCSDNNSTLCQSFTNAIMLKDRDAAPPDLSGASGRNAVIVTGPRIDPLSCIHASACLNPSAARIAFPKQSEASCDVGMAIVLAYADRQGCVCDVRIEQTSHSQSLDQSVLDAVTKWKLPGTGSVTRIPVDFRNDGCK